MFAYYSGRTIEIRAGLDTLQAYAWGRGVLTWLFCGECGCFMFHRPAGPSGDSSRHGVNVRMVDPKALAGAVVNMRDGASGTWDLISSRAL